MSKHFTILGNHRLTNDVARQYRELGAVTPTTPLCPPEVGKVLRSAIPTTPLNSPEGGKVLRAATSPLRGDGGGYEGASYCLFYDDDQTAMAALHSLAESLQPPQGSMSANCAQPPLPPPSIPPRGGSPDAQPLPPFGGTGGGVARPVCHLLLHSRTALRLAQTVGFDAAITDRLDVYPFSLDDEWAGTIQLDRKSVTAASEQVVHLVVFGMGDTAETVAIRAALTAHYPNYVRNHSLRTRITMVAPDARLQADRLIATYSHLFANSHYRIVVADEPRPVVLTHRPDCVAAGMDEFVDVEWEFVESTSHHPMLREKLQLWALDTAHRQLTIVMAGDNAMQNVDRALSLPAAVSRMQVPVYVYMHDDSVLRHLSPSEGVVIPFGMTDRGFDVRRPLVQMARSINYIYNLCYRDNDIGWNGWLRYAPEIDRQASIAQWQRVSPVKRMSNICNAMTVATKLRSVTLPSVPPKGGGSNAQPLPPFGETEGGVRGVWDIPQHDIELLTQVEHNRWCVEELILGWRPCTAEERRLVEADISQKEVLKQQCRAHYDLCSYRELAADATGKPVAIYDLCLCSCLPLIANSFNPDEPL